MFTNVSLPEPVEDQRKTSNPKYPILKDYPGVDLALVVDTPICLKDSQFLAWPWISRWLWRYSVAGAISIHLIFQESASDNEGATVFLARSWAGLLRSVVVYARLMVWFSDLWLCEKTSCFGWSCDSGWLQGWRPTLGHTGAWWSVSTKAYTFCPFLRQWKNFVIDRLLELLTSLC